MAAGDEVRGAGLAALYGVEVLEAAVEAELRAGLETAAHAGEVGRRRGAAVGGEGAVEGGGGRVRDLEAPPAGRAVVGALSGEAL